MKQQRFYFLRQEYFVRFNDPYLMKNHGDLHQHPCFYSFSDKEYPEIYWMIPISHEVKKYRKIYYKKTRNNKRCDTIVFGRVLGEEKAFLIQNMCPVTEKYINNVYLDHGIDVQIDGRLARELEIKANKVLNIVKSTKSPYIIFPDVLEIRTRLLAD
ncbi:hypothetical protein PT285_03630 [Lactobacillus sp. ESL0791]|uniref:type III toxin-antitoxin system CptIN family toxin n=1 Tax=Lactobacillus sp. ESL0791 TaxID=2983234 RepID=UPI0023F96364|nr:hypothetical protein [Lactobacillus sp. ESL0791]MDF7638499.1 hypothetical protein [Lactobacillus sp. ESL0791]